MLGLQGLGRSFLEIGMFKMWLTDRQLAYVSLEDYFFCCFQLSILVCLHTLCWLDVAGNDLGFGD